MGVVSAHAAVSVYDLMAAEKGEKTTQDRSEEVAREEKEHFRVVLNAFLYYR